ncbi:radical SAM protein [Alistipes sp.]|uniref:radical SAM protein n=1 Tax=Alistipes sp. TaxID=1872444 RepID=UPI0025920CDA|nr:radical SAM protein [uncultured Alistipes sp.]
MKTISSKNKCVVNKDFSIQDFFNITPEILTLIPTHKCTASCNNCCFNCSPHIEYLMDINTAKKYVDEALVSFPTIKVLVITGGECFLWKENLINIIKYAVDKYHLIARVVTNGYWATSLELAIARLQPLIDAGLSEINFSTGDEHQKFVKFNNIINGIKACEKLGIKTIIVSIETPPNGKFSSKNLLENNELKLLYQEKKFEYIDAAWMYFKESENIAYPKEVFMLQHSRKPCENIFRGININPYSQLLACCGLTVEYNSFLKIGNVEKKAIKELYASQFNDLYKLWLLVDGPKFIYEKIMNYRNLAPSFFPHDCAYCIEIIKNSENIESLRQILPKEMPNILYRYKVLHKGLHLPH